MVHDIGLATALACTELMLRHREVSAAFLLPLAVIAARMC